MATVKTPLLFLGASGFLGGAFLQWLLAHPRASSFELTAWVRSAEKAKVLEALHPHIKVVSGNISGSEVTVLAENAHIVVEMANSDDVALIEAILSGLRKRHEATGDVPLFFHTSGTGVFVDDARGEYASETIYDDSNVEQLQSLPAEALHRPVDSRIEEADEQGYARTYIVAPGTIYGISEGPLVDAGVSKSHSFQIPLLTKIALTRKRVPVIGAGKARWPSVSVQDTVALFAVLFDAALERPDSTPHGREGFYIAENGEYTFLEYSRALGRVLVEKGLLEDPEPTTVKPEEIVPLYGSEFLAYLFGTNARSRGTRSRAVGWKPKHTVEDYFASAKTEVEAMLKREGKA